MKYVSFPKAAFLYGLVAILLAGFMPGAQSAQNQVYAAPAEPFENMDYDRIELYQTDTGCYVFVEDQYTERCYYMAQEGNEWKIDQELRYQVLPYTYSHNSIIAVYYQSRNEKQALVRVRIGRVYEYKPEDVPSVMDTFGTQFELYEAELEQWGPLYGVHYEYHGLADVSSEDYKIIVNEVQ